AGNSGAEIAVDLADGGAREVSLSVRTPPNIVRRDTLGFPSQVLGIATSRLPGPAVDRIARTMRRISLLDLSSYGLPAPEHPYEERSRSEMRDRKSTRLNSSHEWNSYAVFCRKK